VSAVDQKINFSPGSKNWIAKFFELLEEGVFEIDADLIEQEESNLTHFISHQTGLIYGTAKSFIFSNKFSKKHFNTDEQLQLLLFETLLFTYFRKHSQTFSKIQFIEDALEFYKDYEGLSPRELIEMNFHKSPFGKLELILKSRVGVKSSPLGSNFWLNHLSNAFIFIDIILFRSFLQNKVNTFSRCNMRYTASVFNGLIYTAFMDGVLEDNEKKILQHFLASATLNKSLKDIYKERISSGISLQILKEEHVNDALLGQITFEYAHFLLQSTHLVSPIEKKKLKTLGAVLELNEEQMLQSEEMCLAFISQNGPEEIEIYKQSVATSFAFKETSNRWLRIIGRNKERLILEIKESKELMELLQKSTKEELNKEEKEQVKLQFYDILKSMPSLALFLLPGGTLLLPIVMKLVPELVPSAFKTNELEKTNQKDEL